MSGFYGKLPSHGDFLQRGVTDEFINHWDAWLQEGMACSRSELGEQTWLDLFLTSPVWRFALASGVIGGPVWAGILLPSVDRVGRYFPLTIVAELPPKVVPFELAVAGNGWYDWAESVARRTLEDELVDLNRLEAELRESDALLAAVRPPEAPLDLDLLAATDGPPCWLALGADGDMGRFFARIADGVAAHTREPLGLWWSVGSEHVAASVLMTRGLPAASEFRKLLGDAGQISMPPLADSWPPSLPEPAAAQTSPILPIEVVQATPALLQDDHHILPILLDDVLGSMPQIAPPTTKHWRSAAISNIGRVRDENQDAFVERIEDGLWLVADGMGGHEGGKLASHLVAERIGNIAVRGDFDTVARTLTSAIVEANVELRKCGESQQGFNGGTTVVALYVHQEQGVALWAGDSRLYRLRGEEFEQLTRDHSVAEESGATANGGNMLTRAVGGADLLALEERRLDIKPGDRLLLCSDGLYGELEPEEIAARLTATDCTSAAQSLLALALERGGADNATAVVVAVDSIDT